MLISPPFVLTRLADETDAQYVARCMPDTSLQSAGTKSPEGYFPVSFMLGWHGGMHIEAPVGANNAAEPVRAIADGRIVFVRKPKVRNDKPANEEPLNYNPFGSAPSWTDNGCVIIRHESEYGSTGQTRHTVVYYSIYMHLSELLGEAKKVAAGTQGASRDIKRKDAIGKAGSIYGRERQLHLEIVCDDANLERLVGRSQGRFNMNATGRSDIVLGELYFNLPIGTRFYAERPALNESTPEAQPVHELGASLVVGLRYGNGDGVAAARGDAFLTSYFALLGMQVGEVVGEADGEYNLYNVAEEIANAYPADARPQVRVLYELLRYGRVVGPTALEPLNVPHWRRVRYSTTGVGWVNLNAPHVVKSSDADFPDWRGWRLVDDDADADSRCESATLIRMIEDPEQADGNLTREELQARLGIESVREGLQRVICKTPTEWDTSTAQARWEWLKTDPDFGLDEADFSAVLKHVQAMAIDWASIEQVGGIDLPNVHWHFQAREFICQLRQPSIWHDVIQRWHQAQHSHALPDDSNLLAFAKSILYGHAFRSSIAARRDHQNVASADALIYLDRRVPVIFGMRVNTDINANSGRGLWDDRVTVFQRDQCGLFYLKFRGRITTEPSGWYLDGGQYKQSDNGSSQNAGGTTHFDSGRLISGRSYLYQPFLRNGFGPNISGTQFNILRKVHASFVERLVTNTQLLAQNTHVSGINTSWIRGTTPQFSEDQTMHFHRGYNSMTGSAGCQTFPTTAGEQFSDFAETLKPLAANSRFHYVLSEM